jgi:hypothetical protein
LELSISIGAPNANAPLRANKSPEAAINQSGPIRPKRWQGKLLSLVSSFVLPLRNILYEVNPEHTALHRP